MIATLQNKIRILEQENSELKKSLAEHEKKVYEYIGKCNCCCLHCKKCHGYLKKE